MRHNPIQFAVVREDPLVEAEVIRKSGVENMLLIGSGGCTALTLQALFPKLKLTLVDANPAQIHLIKHKIDHLRSRNIPDRKKIFNIGHDGASGLNACGNFESLFRSFRRFLREFVCSEEDMWQIFDKDSGDGLQALLKHKYWTVAFDLHFSDSLLEAMFGRAAVQHAPPGSYPGYFRQVFEKGLASPGARQNYFLHHVFLGCYRDEDESLPYYLAAGVPEYHFRFIQGVVDDVLHWRDFDLVDLSNIFDWMSEDAVANTAARLASHMRSGSSLMYRQLNHAKDFSRFFADAFTFDATLGAGLLANDRSLFYSKLTVATKL